MLIRSIKNAWYVTRDNGLSWTYLGDNAHCLSEHMKIDPSTRMIDALRM